MVAPAESAPWLERNRAQCIYDPLRDDWVGMNPTLGPHTMETLDTSTLDTSATKLMTEYVASLPDRMSEQDIGLHLLDLDNFIRDVPVDEDRRLSADYRAAVAAKLKTWCVGASTPCALRLLRAVLEHVLFGNWSHNLGSMADYLWEFHDVDNPGAVRPGVSVQDLVMTLADLGSDLDERPVPNKTVVEVLAKFHVDAGRVADEIAMISFEGLLQLQQPSLPEDQSLLQALCNNYLCAWVDLVSAPMVDDVVDVCEALNLDLPVRTRYLERQQRNSKLPIV